MRVSKLLGFFLLFIACRSYGATAKETFARSVKPHQKSSLDYRNDDKLKILNSLLDVGERKKQQDERKAKFSSKLQLQDISRKQSIDVDDDEEPANRVLASEQSMTDSLSRYDQIEEMVRKIMLEMRQQESQSQSQDLDTEKVAKKVNIQDDRALRQQKIQDAVKSLEMSSAMERDKSLRKSGKEEKVTERAKVQVEKGSSSRQRKIQDAVKSLEMSSAMERDKSLRKSGKEEKVTERAKVQVEKSSSSSAKVPGPSQTYKQLLIDEIARMTEDNAAELAESLKISESKNEKKMNSKSKTRLLDTKARLMNADLTSQISPVSALVSHGYNLIRGFPEGDFTSAGPDPGLMTSKQIFQFTFALGKMDDDSLPQPDQVEFQAKTDFAVVNTAYVYGGGDSYRDAASTGVSAAGTSSIYKAYQFSASNAITRAHEDASDTHSIFFERKQTLSLGEVRYLHNEDNVVNDITDEFYAAVMDLPARFGLTASDKEQYRNFLNEWGTEVIIRAEVGLKYVYRYRANYTAAYLFIRDHDDSLVNKANVVSGHANVSLDALNSIVTPSTTFGEYEQQFQEGTQDAPIPLKLYLEPIIRALDSKFWLSRFGDPLGSASAAQMYNMLLIRQVTLGWQLEEYAQTVGTLLSDPGISIPLDWPQGTYSLPQSTSGCPADFTAGCRTQDCEDDNNSNEFSFNIDWDLRGQFDDAYDDVQTCFCSKTSPGESIFSWMPGQYCINRKGGSCPDGFKTGYIEWDDENSNSRNAATGELPDGEYPDSKTRIEYCCRGDGELDKEILLPNTQALVLYPYTSYDCQEVQGMEYVKHYVATDDEDSGNEGKCVGEVPFEPNDCSLPDIVITYCFYQPK